MTSALRRAAMRAILMFYNCEGQSHKTASTDHNLWRERRAEAYSNRGPSAYQSNALPLGQTGSQAICVVSPLLILISKLFSIFFSFLFLFFFFFFFAAVYASCHRLRLPRLSSLAGCFDVSRAQTCHMHRLGQLSFLSRLKKESLRLVASATWFLQLIP